jgi:5-enolpyruvylshikimate-3-phosphate synthase
MEQLRLTPTPHLAGTIKLPGSKSISNRTLLLAALSSGSTLVRDLLDSDDIRHMLAALGLLGVQVEQIGDSRDFRVQGVGGEFPVKSADLFLGNAGTAFRPLTAALALMQGIISCPAWPACTNVRLATWWMHCACRCRYQLPGPAGLSAADHSSGQPACR